MTPETRLVGCRSSRQELLILPLASRSDLAVGCGSLGVSVSAGHLPVSPKPAVALTLPASGWCLARRTHTVTVTNGDGSGATPDLRSRAAVPGGWTASPAASALALAPSASGSTTRLASASTAADGFYDTASAARTGPIQPMPLGHGHLRGQQRGANQPPAAYDSAKTAAARR
jgi:hypothetical protein